MRTLEESSTVESDKAEQAAERDDGDQIVIRTTRARLREYEEKMAREIQNLNVVPPSIGYLSIAAFVFQFMQAIFLFIFAAKNPSDWYLFTSYADPNSRLPSLNEIAAYSVLWLSPVVVLLSGFEHLSCLLFRNQYIWYLERCQNPFRWWEYTFSASLMRVMIAQLVGVTDIHLLICIFMLTAMTIQCGMTNEVVNAKNRADGFPQIWRTVLMAIIMQLTTWGIIFDYFNAAVKASELDVYGVPDMKLLWVIVVMVFLLEASFGVIYVMQWAKMEPVGEDYCEGEKAFILQSFLAKTLLAWLTVAAFKGG